MQNLIDWRTLFPERKICELAQNRVHENVYKFKNSYKVIRGLGARTKLLWVTILI